MLPDLTRLLTEMQVQGQQLAALQQSANNLREKARNNGHHNPAEEGPTEEGPTEEGPAEEGASKQTASALEDAFKAGLEQLAQWNIELKDLQRGLVDFPALRDGRTVFLCWLLGEPEVAFWHETTTGFAGRKPLDDKLS